MSNVSRGFAYEREVKQHFVDAGWGCTRAAHSASAMDLIAFRQAGQGSVFLAGTIFQIHGYRIGDSTSTKIPMRHLASKIEKKHIKHVYWEVVSTGKWTVVLMQCKIRKR